MHARPMAGRAAGRARRGPLLALLLAAGLLPRCAGDAPTAPQETVLTYRLPFQLEYRAEGTLTFSARGDALEGTMVLDQDHAFLRAGVSYPASGRRYSFPESRHVLYTWKIPVAGVPASTCPEGSATLSVSLNAWEGSRKLSGGVTAYCGASTAGKRSFRVMRLSGDLEPTGEQKR